MILGIDTFVHVVLSLIGILSGLVVAYGFLAAKRFDGWTGVFLATTVLTSVTGFFFPFHKFLPSHAVGTISLIVLAIAAYARYGRKMAGGWRRTYVITAMVALYLNVFVLVAQLFMKVPALRALAPTQSEPPFVAAHVTVLLLFVVLSVLATIRFGNEQLRTNSRVARRANSARSRSLPESAGIADAARPMLASRGGRFFANDRHIHQVFREKPYLKLVGADHIGDEQVIGSVVARFGGLLSHGVSLFQNQLVSFEKTGDLHGHGLTAARKPGNHGRLRHVRRHSQADAAQELNPLCDLVYQLILFAVMLIKEQMELVKSMAGDLPVMFLVHITEGYGVGENLIEIVAGGCAGLFVQSDRQLGDLAIRLNFGGALMLDGTGLFRSCFKLIVAGTALIMFGAHGISSCGLNWIPTLIIRESEELV